MPMRLDPLFQAGKPTISFEFFPPKTDEGFASLYRTIEELKPLQPSYVSVTLETGSADRAANMRSFGVELLRLLVGALEG